MTAVLVADNEAGSLNHLSDLVRESGFRVLRATNPHQAKAILESGRADVAVLDLRLEDQSDEFDLTGLEVAQKTDDMIPKIIVSHFDSKEALADALKINIKGSPTVVEFIKKKNVATHLIPAIENAVRIRQAWSAMAQSRVSNQLNQDYRTARRDARLHYYASSIISIGFAGLIFYGAYNLHGKHDSSLSGPSAYLPLLFTVLGVLVAEITNYLLGRKLEFLYERVERFHAELLQTNRFEQLLDSSYAIKDEESREAFKKTLFEAAASEWLSRDKLFGSGEHGKRGEVAPAPVSRRMAS